MGVQETPYSLRLGREAMQKIRVLAEKEKRSVNMQLCVAVEDYLERTAPSLWSRVRRGGSQTRPFPFPSLREGVLFFPGRGAGHTCIRAVYLI